MRVAQGLAAKDRDEYCRDGFVLRAEFGANFAIPKIAPGDHSIITFTRAQALRLVSLGSVSGPLEGLAELTLD